MTFKEFLQLDELDGQYGSVKAHQGPLQLIQAITKMVTLPKGAGSSVSRLMKAGGGALPARPAKISSVNGPLTKPTFLK
jgi:hypothetical protein